MPILFRCENCRQKISISRRKAGQMLNCPKCAQEMMVPIPKAKSEKTDAPAEVPDERSELPPTRELPRTLIEDEWADEDKGWAPTRDHIEKDAKRFAETAPQQVSHIAGLEPPPKPERLFPRSSPPPEPIDDEEELTFRSPRSEMDEMDLTPMVDVTFLLLIFFMITASFSLTKSIESPAPDPENQGAQTLQNLEELEMTSIMVRIDAQDDVFVDDEPVDAFDLENVFGDKLRAEQKNELVIQASPLSRHETFVAVFDAATGAGMQKIRLAATRGEE